MAMQSKGGCASEAVFDAIECGSNANAVDYRVEALRALVKEYGIFAGDGDAWLAYGLGESRIVFNLDLHGEHLPRTEYTTVCAECNCLKLALHAVARYVLPGKADRHCDRNCMHEIQHASGPTPHTATVTLSVVHSTQSYASPETEPDCLQRLQSRLRQLGIEERSPSQ